MTSTQTDNFAEVSESMKEQEFILREIPLKLSISKTTFDEHEHVFQPSYLIGVLPNRRTTTGQLAKSLLPVGVMMCVLTEHDLILLDCCDIVDSATGYLLEFFAYMASSHLFKCAALSEAFEISKINLSSSRTNMRHRLY
ncbi:unnamed protein product [Rhizophagus irregularis]|uniref:Uncharacterized protein n=1 Tax=Rhizophagus irregularis TaxID=588596 RepID=A0A915Z1R6_9GLOM|nr:unnamed protein product [Rhizophagus irregularis]